MDFLREVIKADALKIPDKSIFVDTRAKGMYN
jgi:hypothetical protein